MTAFEGRKVNTKNATYVQKYLNVYRCIRMYKQSCLVLSAKVR